MRRFLVLALWGLAGCPVDVDLSNKACDAEGLCAAGFRCVQAVCVEDSRRGRLGNACRDAFPQCDSGLSCVQGTCQTETVDAGPPVDAGEEIDAGNGMDAAVPDAGLDCGWAGDECCPDDTCQAGLACRSNRCLCLAEVTANEHQTCALTGAGQVQCVGRNQNGQLGDGMVVLSQPTPVTADLPESTRQVACGAFHACALGESNLYCWGWDDDGQLGLGPDTSGNVPSPSVVSGAPSDIVQMGLDSFHSCARTASNQLWCWGQNARYQLGLAVAAPAPDVPEPTQVPDLPVGTMTDLALGAFHTCVLIDGEVWCWGLNDDGQLGGGETSVATPVATRAVGLSGVVDIEAGDWHTCALTDEGRMWCWGRNASGQLGRGAPGGPQPSPAPVISIGVDRPVIQMATMDDHSCAVDSGRNLFCWGDNESGQLGQRTTGGVEGTPQLVLGIPPVIDVDGGRRHTCATTGDGEVYCFGFNGFGELGNGTMVTTTTPAVSLFSCP